MEHPKFTPGFVLVDVKAGRAILKKRIEAGQKVRIHAVIELDYAGNEDGISQEFTGAIKSYEEVI